MKVDIKKLLLEKIKTKGRFTIKDIQEEIDISRQAIHRHIKKILEEGKIIKIGTTRGAEYIASNRKLEITQRIRRTYSRIGLQEDMILQSVFLSLNLKNPKGLLLNFPSRPEKYDSSVLGIALILYS